MVGVSVLVKIMALATVAALATGACGLIPMDGTALAAPGETAVAPALCLFTIF